MVWSDLTDLTVETVEINLEHSKLNVGIGWDWIWWLSYTAVTPRASNNNNNKLLKLPNDTPGEVALVCTLFANCFIFVFASAHALSLLANQPIRAPQHPDRFKFQPSPIGNHLRCEYYWKYFVTIIWSTFLEISLVCQSGERYNIMNNKLKAGYLRRGWHINGS